MDPTPLLSTVIQSPELHSTDYCVARRARFAAMMHSTALLKMQLSAVFQPILARFSCGFQLDFAFFSTINRVHLTVIDPSRGIDYSINRLVVNNPN
jgi:hypothetical protein